MSCRPDAPAQQTSAEKPFIPTGTLSDLVYNPIRADGSIDSSFLPIFQWQQDTTFLFGEVKEGEIIERTFWFKNIGTAPLLITNATSTCGCTIPEWPATPVSPDSMGRIDVKFNTLNRTGQQTKQVFIFANTIPNQSSLYLTGRVAPKE